MTADKTADQTAHDPARASALEASSPCDRHGKRVAAFHPAYRPSILALTGAAAALEDLAESFPALLFALASGYADDRARAQACALICQGASLRAARPLPRGR